MKKILNVSLFLILAGLSTQTSLSKPTTQNFFTNNSAEQVSSSQIFNEPLFGRGCCSSHGGEAYCSVSGRWMCADGWESSCSCR